MANLQYHWYPSQVEIVAAQYDAMKNGLYTDFTIITKDGWKFNVHRLCLARIPYFSVMFNNNVKETIQKTAYEDINKDVCSVLLEYIYTGRSDKIGKYAEELLICADKYRMDELVERSSVSLMESLCADNALRYLDCASSIGLEKLKKPILHFIERNIERVMQSDDWSWIVEDFRIVTDVLCELAVVRGNWGCTKGKLSICDLGVRYIRWDIPKVASSQTLYLPDCYYEFDSPEFVVTDLLGMKYVMKMKYRSKPDGNASIIVFIATKEMKFICSSEDLMPPSLHCKWVLPSHDLCSWHAGRWRCIPKNRGQLWSFTIEPTFLLDNPFMLDQIFMVSLSDHVLIRISQLHSPFQQNPIHHDASRSVTVVSKRHENPFDTTIVVRGKPFEVHGTVLTSQSRRLAAMLSSSQSKYVLEDISPKAFQGLLNLMYESKTFPSQEPDQLELLRTAENFEVDGCLIKKYECFLAEKLNPKNAVLFLLCANEVGSEKLKSSAMQFITHNVKTVIASNEWHKMQQHTALIVDMIGVMITLVTDSPIEVSRSNYNEWIPNWSLLNSL